MSYVHSSNSNTRNQFLLKYLLRVSLIFVVAFGFVSGPMASMGPIDFRLFDLFTLFCFCVLLLIINKNPITLTKNNLLLTIFFIYVLFAIGLPIIGIILYNYPIGYIVGDLRWLQILIIIAGFFVISNGSPDRVIDILLVSFKVLIITNVIFVTIQVLHWLNISDLSYLVEWWYIGRHVDFGQTYHIGRFSGATGSISGLGLLSSTSVIIFLYSYFKTRSDASFLILSSLLLVASGTRTALAIVSIFIVTSTMFIYLRTQDVVGIKKKLQQNLWEIGIILATLLSTLYILYEYNIGRIRTSSRYADVLGILTGATGFDDSSGRVSRWEPVLYYVESEFHFGTLANPSWVLDDFRAIDSYFVITYLQGNIVFLIVYIFLLFLLLLYSIRLILTNRDYGLVIYGFCTIIIFSSITQNFMTSIAAKLILALVIILYLSDFERT